MDGITTSATPTGAAIIAFPEREEDIIATVIRLLLVEADAKVIVRRRRNMP